MSDDGRWGQKKKEEKVHGVDPPGRVRVFSFRILPNNEVRWSLMGTMDLTEGINSAEVQKQIADYIGTQHWFRAHRPYLVLCRGMSFTINY